MVGKVECRSKRSSSKKGARRGHDIGSNAGAHLMHSGKNHAIPDHREDGHMNNEQNDRPSRRRFKRFFLVLVSPVAATLVAYATGALQFVDTFFREDGAASTVRVLGPVNAPFSLYGTSSLVPPANGATGETRPAAPEVVRSDLPSLQQSGPAVERGLRMLPPPAEASPAPQATAPVPVPQSPSWYEPAEGAVPGERPRTVFHRASLQGFAGQCVPRIRSHYGVAGGIVSNALLQPGNPNCLQARYGDVMAIEIELCGGRPVPVSRIEVERMAAREDGRPWTSRADILYTLIAGGQETLPLRLGTGGYNRHQAASFAPMPAEAVRVLLRSPRSRGYDIYQRLCSISVR